MVLSSLVFREQEGKKPKYFVTKPCESVFIFDGVTYNGCTIEGSNNGKAWCSTKVDPISWEHAGNDFYGNCPDDGSCLTDEQGKEELQTLIEAECTSNFDKECF